MAPLKITYVLPNVESGGTERHVLHLVRRIDPLRFSLSLVTVAGGGSLHGTFAERIPVTVMGDPATGRAFRKSYLEQIVTVRALARHLRARKPDILHSYLPAANVIGPVAARLGVRSTRDRQQASDGGLQGRCSPCCGESSLRESAGGHHPREFGRGAAGTSSGRSGHWEGKFRKIYNGVAPIEPWTPGRGDGVPAA